MEKTIFLIRFTRCYKVLAKDFDKYISTNATTEQIDNNKGIIVSKRNWANTGYIFHPRKDLDISRNPI